MSSDDIAISVGGLSKSYRIFGHPGDRLKQALTLGRVGFHREFEALKDISFSVSKGETVGIIGRNGSGKSTLLQLICGILKPTSGSVTVSGRISALLELGTGFHPEFTGRENVYFQGAVMGFSPAQMDHRFDGIAAFADIGEFIDQPVRTYSSGMYVRLAFSVAVHSDPEILIVDEALAVGDIAFQAKCMLFMERLRQKDVAILLVTHDLNAVKSLCSRAICLRDGRLADAGSASDVAENYLRDMRRKQTSDRLPPSASAEHSRSLPLQKGFLGDNPTFAKSVAPTRYGSGQVRFTNIEIIDTENVHLEVASFAQKARIRLYLYFEKACAVVVSYYLRDDMLMILAGSSTTLEGYGPVSGLQGESKLVDFLTTLPLAEGNYNLMASLSIPILVNREAQFVDHVENACVFKVAQRHPLKIWSKLHIPNVVTVHDL